LASGDGVQLHRNYCHRVIGKAQFGQVFTFQMQADRLANVRGYFIQGVALGHDGKIQALGDVLGFASENTNLNRPASHGTNLMLDSTLEFCNGE
jgi:hypothetical protein